GHLALATFTELRLELRLDAKQGEREVLVEHPSQGRHWLTRIDQLDVARDDVRSKRAITRRARAAKQDIVQPGAARKRRQRLSNRPADARFVGIPVHDSK